MNIVMLTNTYTPHVGGVARSVDSFVGEYRRRGHRVLVVAPEFPDASTQELDVVRVPAIQKFNGSDFSVALPVPASLSDTLDTFRPDVIHAHHPFLLGMTAVRIARFRSLPLVFTHHTLYEQYTHYVPGDSPPMKRFAIELATRFANLTDHVFAPSESVRDLLLERGVTTPIAVVPTGVDIQRFASGDGAGFRSRIGLPAAAFVVGHVGRLAPEKNLEFLARAVALLLQHRSDAHFVVVGSGPSEQMIQEVCSAAGVADRLHLAGVLQHDALTDALHAMDVFAFASKSETQGMVLTEAMAAGVPVVALDAPGAREVVKDRENGRLLCEESVDTFCAALAWIGRRSQRGRHRLARAARNTAEGLSMPRCADKALRCYATLVRKVRADQTGEEREWENVLNLFKAEWDIVKSIAGAAGEAAIGGSG